MDFNYKKATKSLLDFLETFDPFTGDPKNIDWESF